MARRHKKHEEHTNTEAWAIPYGDLITLLLAFFVVMYAISSINEGKFRVLSDSLQAAFRGTPRTLEPVQVGEKTRGSGADISMTLVQQSMMVGQPRKMLETISINDAGGAAPPASAGLPGRPQPLLSEHPIAKQLARVADELETALKSLVDASLVTVRRHEFWLEVEVKTDILFASGEANLSDKAIPALDALAATLQKYPNPVRVEGHTDNRPINSRVYPSNWELSAARAASVVHRFARSGMSPERLSVIGFGEYRPAQSNSTGAGRDANRRVVIVILAGEGAPVPMDAAGIADEASKAGASAALPPIATDIAPVTTVTPPATAASPAGTEPAPLPVTVGASAGNPAQE